MESQAGESELYKKSYNGFGIKASAPWQGPKVSHQSLEADGKLYESYFRKYGSLEESIADHASPFFTSTPYRRQTAYKKRFWLRLIKRKPRL
nr:glucosaminidase domain-containing protein [Facklamia hominis]